MPASPTLDPISHVGERVAVVIPTLNEAESIGAVIAALPRHLADHIIVAACGSTDGTPQIARGAGAEVIALGTGYWRACLAGAEAAGDSSVLVFMDGDGADDPSTIEEMVAALRSGGFEFVIGSRTRGKREASSMAGVEDNLRSKSGSPKNVSNRPFPGRSTQKTLGLDRLITTPEVDVVRLAEYHLGTIAITRACVDRSSWPAAQSAPRRLSNDEPFHCIAR